MWARKGKGGAGRAKRLVLPRLAPKEKQRILDRITRMLTSCMKHSSGWTGVQTVIRYQDWPQAIVCRQSKVTDPETIATFLDGELDGVDDEYYLSPRRSQTTRLLWHARPSICAGWSRWPIWADTPREKQPPKIVWLSSRAKRKANSSCR